jgi:hypothetical protein
VWYWRQVLVAIAISVGDDLRHHKLLACRAVLIGWVANWLLFRYLVHPVSVAGGQSIWNWTVVHGFDSFRTLWFGRPRWLVPPLPIFVTSCLGWMVNGWIVGRLHRRHRLAMVFVFVVCLVAWNVPFFISSTSYLHRTLYREALAAIFPLVVLPACAFSGGILGASERDTGGHELKDQEDGR